MGAVLRRPSRTGSRCSPVCVSLASGTAVLGEDGSPHLGSGRAPILSSCLPALDQAPSANRKQSPRGRHLLWLRDDMSIPLSLSRRTMLITGHDEGSPSCRGRPPSRGLGPGISTPTGLGGVSPAPRFTGCLSCRLRTGSPRGWFSNSSLLISAFPRPPTSGLGANGGSLGYVLQERPCSWDDPRVPPFLRRQPLGTGVRWPSARRFPALWLRTSHRLASNIPRSSLSRENTRRDRMQPGYLVKTAPI